MYYVIQILHDSADKHFISYQVPKYILSTKNKNIIFEFGEKPDIKRKWAPREDIVLLTQDKEFFKAYLAKRTDMENEHLQKIDDAKEEVQRLLQEHRDKLMREFKHFQELSAKNTKVPSLLKDQEK